MVGALKFGNKPLTIRWYLSDSWYTTKGAAYTPVFTVNLSFLKKPLIQKRRWSCDFPPRKKQLPKSTARFPVKKRWHSPPPVGLPWAFPPPPPESVWSYADVTTKIFWIDRLPNLLSNGAPLAGFAHRLCYKNLFYSSILCLVENCLIYIITCLLCVTWYEYN